LLGWFGGGYGVEANQALDGLDAEDVLFVEGGHAGVFGVVGLLVVAGADFFFAGVLGDA
jgi:hypothetical protein